MPSLVALAVPGGPAFVDHLTAAWDAGDAVLPVDPRLPPAARARVLASLAPEVLIEADGSRHALEGGRPVDEGDALVIATSGTTGDPKGVVLTHEAVAASATATSARLGVDPASDRWLACLPLAHVGGLGVVTRALVTGTPLVVHPGFDPDAVVAAADEGATLVSLVPTALDRVGADRFRWVLLGGSSDWRDRPANVVRTYGLTETGGGIAYDGVPLQGVEVRVDEGGVISVRGPMLLRCYRDGRVPFDNGGWFATGDLGALDVDGRLTVHGRAGDLIVTGGENVWPEAVEGALRPHPAIADVAVAGRPDDRWGQRVVAFVVPAPGHRPPSLEEVRAQVKQTLPAFAAPQEVVVVDAVPRTALGKVRRRAVANAGDGDARDPS